MLSVIKDCLIGTKDYAGRDIDAVITRLAAQTGTPTYVWSYLRDEAVYENTDNGIKIYPHEMTKYSG